MLACAVHLRGSCWGKSCTSDLGAGPESIPGVKAGWGHPSAPHARGVLKLGGERLGIDVLGPAQGFRAKRDCWWVTLLHNAAEMFEGRWWYLRWGDALDQPCRKQQAQWGCAVPAEVWLRDAEVLRWPGHILGSPNTLRGFLPSCLRTHREGCRRFKTTSACGSCSPAPGQRCPCLCTPCLPSGS